MTQLEFLNHYELVQVGQDHVVPTFQEAKEVAKGDLLRIWFIREVDDYEFWTDECNETAPDADDHAIYDKWVDDMIQKHGFAPWVIESWRGQFVNCLGFFVTTKPCDPAHVDTIFTY